jgi:hypothetical protein
MNLVAYLKLPAAVSFLLVILSFTPTCAVAASYDSMGWSLGICGIKTNVLTGEMQQEFPTVKSCVRLVNSRIKVISARTEPTRIAACNAYWSAKKSLAISKAQSGYIWFGDFICTNDCSGHEAGFLWAKQKSVLDEAECKGNSDAFEQGCFSFVKEYEQRAFERDNCDKR